MSDDKSPGEKEFEPTDRKLEKARLRGEVVRSQEAGAALALIILTATVSSLGHMIGNPLVKMIQDIYSLDALISFQNGVSLMPLVLSAVAKAELHLLGALAFAGLFLNLAITNLILLL